MSCKVITNNAAQPDNFVGAMQERRLIRLAEVKRRTGMSTSTIYRWMKEGRFPQSHKIGGYIARWCETEVNDWVLAVTENQMDRPKGSN